MHKGDMKKVKGTFSNKPFKIKSVLTLKQKESCKDNIQKEFSVCFTLSFHAHYAQIERVVQNLVLSLLIHDIFHLNARAAERI